MEIAWQRLVVDLAALTAALCNVEEWHVKLSAQLEVEPKSGQVLSTYVVWQQVAMKP